MSCTIAIVFSLLASDINNEGTNQKNLDVFLSTINQKFNENLQ